MTDILREVINLRTMRADFIKYRDFFEQETASELILLLRENGIEYEIEEYRDGIAPVYHDHILGNVTTVKLRKEDFPKVDDLLAAQATEALTDIDPNHYLFSFTNEELFEIISKPDEWSAFDYQLTKNILRKRGVMVDDAMLSKLKQQRLEQLAEPEPDQSSWVQAGYLAALAGGLGGIFIGWHLMTFKKVLPNGDRVYGYRKHDRTHGRWIFWVGMIVFPVAFYLKFFRS